jgi:murein L,D-transpeptidase YafK
MKPSVLFFFSIVVSSGIAAQYSFIDYQKSFSRVAYAAKLKEDTLKKQFAVAGLQWPAKQIYIRSFKYDSQLEVWVRNSNAEPFKLFKTYKICALAGSLGPKRMQDDYQVPEGFYYINQFNPRSSYHLSLGINYPNESDKILSDSLMPGGDIFIHGSCITVGCIPIQDAQIEEVYLLAINAKNAGQDFIPVHIFPIRFSNPKSVEYFNRISINNTELQTFTLQLKKVYDYFEAHKTLPVIAVNKQGTYLSFNN